MTTRRVRHLRVVAGTGDAARAAVPRLEDALRCASLPETGTRLLLVRRLALGRIARQASSQAIARVIEARFADSAVAWTDGAGPDAPGAEHVVFRSAWHARVALTRRLLLGRACSAWYWPLAVPEFRIGASADANVRAIARAVAMSEEASVALPAWAAHAVQGGGARTLAALLPPAFGSALLHEAGIAMRLEAPELAAPTVSPKHTLPPPWLTQLLAVAGWRGETRPHKDSHASSASPTGLADAPRPGPSPPRRRSAASIPPAAAFERTAREHDEFTRAPLVDPTSSTASESAPAPVASDPLFVDLPPEFDAAATACGGLLFLLPVLARLGLPRWAEHAAPDPGAWTRAVLGVALDRLRAEPGDPMWSLAALDAPLSCHRARAPASWQNLLSAPRGAPSPPLSLALTEAASAQEQATLWLTAARRWLRRGARIGLASLVLRPGWLSLTPTHADVHFRLDAVDLRVRRIGLDIDPGWLPWFGRVVTYHYRDVRDLP